MPAVSAAARSIDDTPVSVIDFETTGLSPKMGARVVEVAVVRCPPGSPPELAFHSLVHPGGPVHGTRIHGITDAMVADAPRFREIAGEVLYSLRESVVAAFNATFDIAFLGHELRNVSFVQPHVAEMPYFCLMHLPRRMRVGKRCSLEEATGALGIPRHNAHRAHGDALSAASVWLHYRELARNAGRRTFADLAAVECIALEESLSFSILSAESANSHREAARQWAKRPIRTPEPPSAGEESRRRYWHALHEALADENLTDEEIASLSGIQQRLQLSPADIRAVHLRYASHRSAEMLEDGVISRVESGLISEMFEQLRRLGWAPGDAAQVS